MWELRRQLKQTVGRLFKNRFIQTDRKSQIILMYHRVVDKMPDKMLDPHMFVRSATLDMHIKELSRYFQMVDLEAVLHPESKNKSLCAITFDDGWLDNHDVAFPVLFENRCPATIFIPVMDIGTTSRFWFDDLFVLAGALETSESVDAFMSYFHAAVPEWSPAVPCRKSLLQLAEALKKRGPSELNEIIKSAYKRLNIEPCFEKTLMDWDQVRKLGEQGISFGSHGLNHEILTTLGSREKRNIVFKSLLLLRNKAKSTIPFFSYPNGNWDSETVTFLKEAGYLGAVTTKSGHINGSDPFLLNRIGLSEINSNTKNLLWFEIFKAFRMSDNSSMPMN